MPTIQIDYDQQDMDAFGAFCLSMERKASRAALLPILTQYLEPMVDREKAFLSSHNKSGALSGSLAARSGSGDRPGTISVFSAATATSKELESTWGKSTAQKRGFVTNIKKKTGRRKVFYSDFVEKGHRLVKVNAAGQGRTVGMVAPIPFAQQAVDSLGDQQAEAAAKAVLDYIVG